MASLFATSLAQALYYEPFGYSVGAMPSKYTMLLSGGVLTQTPRDIEISSPAGNGVVNQALTSIVGPRVCDTSYVVDTAALFKISAYCFTDGADLDAAAYVAITNTTDGTAEAALFGGINGFSSVLQVTWANVIASSVGSRGITYRVGIIVNPVGSVSFYAVVATAGPTDWKGDNAHLSLTSPLFSVPYTALGAPPYYPGVYFSGGSSSSTAVDDIVIETSVVGGDEGGGVNFPFMPNPYGLYKSQSTLYGLLNRARVGV